MTNSGDDSKAMELFPDIPRKARIDSTDVVRQLLEDICYCLHRHEVQTWKDCPGTIEERSKVALNHARVALSVLSGKVSPSDAATTLAESIGVRDLAATGGLVDAT